MQRKNKESQRGHFNIFQPKQADLDAPELQIHHTRWNCAEGNNFPQSLTGQHCKVKVGYDSIQFTLHNE